MGQTQTRCQGMQASFDPHKESGIPDTPDGYVNQKEHEGAGAYMKKMDGLEELLSLNIDTDTETHTIIEGSIADDVSFLYDVTTNEYLIESDRLAEKEGYEEMTMLIDPESFNGIDLDGYFVSKEDFLGFKDFVESQTKKGKGL